MTEIIAGAAALFALAQFIVLLIVLRNTAGAGKGGSANGERAIEEFGRRLDRMEGVLREEFSRNRDESARSSKTARDELNGSFMRFAALLEQKLAGVQEAVNVSAKHNRDELARSLSSFEEKIGAKVTELNRDTRENFDKIRDSVEKKLQAIQTENSEKLEKMRETVDEKLHKTLETRLGESFKLVSERLELVQKGLGEMQTLATGVGDLKKVLANVKTKGVLGEYQLAGILEQILTPAQYERNVKTKKGSNDQVEFAVKIPGKDESNRTVWLPIDAKFPTEDYTRLMNAYDSGDAPEKDAAVKALRTRIMGFAKDISSKYVDPPNTTDFAIMFLPFEGLFAEVLRIAGLFEAVQREYRVVITGPTTVSAFLSSLQMGFRSLAVEKRTSEIWELLGAVKTEFGKFGEVLERTKQKLDLASKEIENAGTRSRAIERKLRDVQELPGSEQPPAAKLLADEI